MGITYSGGGGSAKIRYCFVDAAYLRRLVSEISSIYFGNLDCYNELNFNALIGTFKKTYYYDCC